MNRSSVAAIAVCAALLGVGAGYLLAPREAGVASLAPVQPAAPAPPGAPNGIAALATANSGAPVVPRAAGASQLLVSLATFTVALEAADGVTAARACANAALDKAQAGLGHPGDPPALDASPCGGEGASRLTGRIRLSSRPAVALVGQQSPGPVTCDATLRFQVEGAGGAPAEKELHASAFGDTAALACDAAGRDAIVELVGVIGGGG